MKGLNVFAWALVIIGGLNWLLVGLFQWDLVGGIFGGMDTVLSRIIYVLVGLAALYCIGLYNRIADESREPARN